MRQNGVGENDSYLPERTQAFSGDRKPGDKIEFSIVSQIHQKTLLQPRIQSRRQFTNVMQKLVHFTNLLFKLHLIKCASIYIQTGKPDLDYVQNNYSKGYRTVLTE